MPPELIKKEEEIRIAELEDRLTKLEKSPIGIGVDATTRGNVEDIVDGFLEPKIFDIAWNDYYYYSSLFGEAIERFQTAGAGTEAHTDNGYTLETTADSDSTSQIQLRATNVNSVLRFDKDTRFRITVAKDDITNSELTVKTLEDDLSGDYLGFRIDDATVLGLSATGGVESTVTLGTYAADQKDTYELRYTPGGQVTFYIQKQAELSPTPRGTLTTNLPIERTGDKFILDAEMKTTTTTQFTATVYAFEFTQRR